MRGHASYGVTQLVLLNSDWMALSTEAGTLLELLPAWPELVQFDGVLRPCLRVRKAHSRVSDELRQFAIEDLNLVVQVCPLQRREPRPAVPLAPM